MAGGAGTRSDNNKKWVDSARNRPWSRPRPVPRQPEPSPKQPLGLDILSGHANSLTLLLPTPDEQRRNQTLKKSFTARHPAANASQATPVNIGRRMAEKLNPNAELVADDTSPR